MSAASCGASAFLAASGPAAVPFRLCCALAIVHAGGPEPASFVCGAADRDPDPMLFWPGVAPEMPSIGEPAR
jgi:hypothetical protein